MFTAYNESKAMSFLDFSKNVQYFLKYWPKDTRTHDLGCKIMCLLHTYRLKNNPSSWLNFEKILSNYLGLLKDMEPELAADCIDALDIYLDSTYFNPPGKFYTQSWFSGELKYTKKTEQFLSLQTKIKSAKKELNITEDSLINKAASIVDNSIKLSGSLMKLAIKNPTKTMFGLMYLHSTAVEGCFWKEVEKGWHQVEEGWHQVEEVVEQTTQPLVEVVNTLQEAIPEPIKNLANELPIVPVPLPGPYCGPDSFKPVAWAIADKWQFPTAQVSFADSCKHHDACWDHSSSRKQANECDSAFYKELKEECKDKLTGNAREICNKIATAYHAAVVVENERRHWKL